MDNLTTAVVSRMGSGNLCEALDAADAEEFLTSGELTIDHIHNLSSKLLYQGEHENPMRECSLFIVVVNRLLRSLSRLSICLLLLFSLSLSLSLSPPLSLLSAHLLCRVLFCERDVRAGCAANF